MAHHPLNADAQEDQRILRRLFSVIGIFALATGVMAIVIGLILG